jgi:AraC-like DNA-binding protein
VQPRFETVGKSAVTSISGRPSDFLAGKVRAYTGYREEVPREPFRREIPSGDVALILGLGSSLLITDTENGHTVRRKSFVAGLQERHVRTEVEAGQHGIEIRLLPSAAYTLLGVPMHTLTNHAVALRDVLGREADLLAEQLSELEDWGQRFRILDTSLARHLSRGRAPSGTTVWALRRLEESSGTLTVSDLAREIGCSRKHLSERFREEVGVPPKVLARILRFRKALIFLRSPQLGPAEVARRCGYYDQAHLTRDFRAFTGLPPTRFASASAT